MAHFYAAEGALHSSGNLGFMMSPCLAKASFRLLPQIMDLLFILQSQAMQLLPWRIVVRNEVMGGNLFYSNIDEDGDAVRKTSTKDEKLPSLTSSRAAPSSISWRRLVSSARDS